MELLFALAVLLPLGLGGWVLALLAYVRAREADRRAAALERRIAALEQGRVAGP